ncbi:MAG: hypothetical protein U1A27_02135 [Phycisphaerae bacterium]
MPARSNLAMQGLVSIGFALALLLAGPGRAWGQLVLYQKLPDHNFGYSSDTTYLNDAGQGSAQIVADSFALASGGSVCGVNWWGFYGGTFGLDPGPPAGDETMRVRFYENAAGLPGAVLAEHTFLNPTRVSTGAFVGGSETLRREYRFQAALPSCFAAAAGVTYWFEAQQVGEINSRFRWETSSQGDNRFATRFPVDTDWRISNQPDDLSFRLLTPEPTGGLLMLLALIGAARSK